MWKNKYKVYFKGYIGQKFDNKIYEEYKKKIDSSLVISNCFSDKEEEQEVVDTLKKSLENGKDFYTNATPRIRIVMEEYEKMKEKGVEF